MTLSRMELKKIRSLKTKKGRRTYNLFLGEGVRLLEQAWRHGVRPEIVYFSSDMISERGEILLQRMAKKNIKQQQIPAKQLEMIADAKTPQGMIGIFVIPVHPLKKLYDSKVRTILTCENIADPGNMGTLLRSALAFGFNSVLLCGACVEPYAPKVVRSSVGALFGLYIRPVTYRELETVLQRKHMVAIATDIAGTRWSNVQRKIMQAGFRMLMVGAEAEGLSARLKNLAHLSVRIVHSEKVESLNAAVAGSIIMKQMYDLTQRR